MPVRSDSGWALAFRPTAAAGADEAGRVLASAPAAAALLATVSGALACGVTARRRRCEPQATQKLAPAALTWAQTGQTGGGATRIGEPQLAQNLAESSFSERQREHCIDTPRSAQNRNFSY
jgi:hypothetical protein